MDSYKYERLRNILYEENLDIVKRDVEQIDNSIFLHIFACNYNWNDGFEIPSSIINNENCDLGTALMLFYSADGYRMLQNEQEFIDSELEMWKLFLTKLYSKITDSKFKHQNIAFSPPLTKVQIFKLKKNKPNIPRIFLEQLKGNYVEIPRL